MPEKITKLPEKQKPKKLTFGEFRDIQNNRIPPVTCYQFSSHYKAIPGIIHDHPFYNKLDILEQMQFLNMLPAFDTAKEAMEWASKYNSRPALDEILYHMTKFATSMHHQLLNISGRNKIKEYIPIFKNGKHHTLYYSDK